MNFVSFYTSDLDADLTKYIGRPTLAAAAPFLSFGRLAESSFTIHIDDREKGRKLAAAILEACDVSYISIVAPRESSAAPPAVIVNEEPHSRAETENEGPAHNG